MRSIIIATLILGGFHSSVSAASCRRPTFIKKEFYYSQVFAKLILQNYAPDAKPCTPNNDDE